MTYTPLEPLSQHPEQPLDATFAGYTILRLLGSGAMGEVYLAQHPRLPRRDALKILRTDVSADEDYRQRFIREADQAATLWHPNISTSRSGGGCLSRCCLTRSVSSS
jgi:serine/threonine protein kinase